MDGWMDGWMDVYMYVSGMGIFWLSSEFRLFRDSSNFEEKMCMCICTSKLRVADAVHSSHDRVRHFIPIQFVLSWLEDVSFENGPVSRAYVRFLEACKRDCGRRKQACEVS